MPCSRRNSLRWDSSHVSKEDSLRLWKDFWALLYWDWDHAAPESVVDWTEAQCDLTRAWSWEVE